MSELISDVRIYPTTKNNKVPASVSFVVAGAFALKAFIRKTSGGLMVSMPARPYEKDNETKWAEYHYPITKEAREEMIEKVMAEYEKQTDGNKQAGSESKPSKSKGGVPF